MTALDQRLQAQMADLLDRIADLEAQVRGIPSRTINTDTQNLVLEITQAAHGFTAGDVVRHNGTIWVLASANDVAADEKLGLVGLVLSNDAFLVVLAGCLCLQGLTDWTIYYLGTSGDLVAAPPAHPAIRRAVLLHTTGDVCQLVGPHLTSAHAHLLGDLRDVNLTGLADGQTIVYEAASSTFKPGAAVPSIAGRSVLGNAGNTTAVPTAVTATAADQILMATATGLAWDQITFASIKTSGPGLLGRTPAGAGTAELVTVGARLTFTGGTLNADPDTVLGLAATGYVRRTGANTYAAAGTVPWGDLSGVPATFPPSAHNHSASDITSGVLSAARLPAIGAAVSTDNTTTGTGAVLSFSVPASNGTIGTIQIRTKYAEYNAKWLKDYEVDVSNISPGGTLGCQIAHFSNATDTIRFGAPVGAGANGANGALLVAYNTGAASFEVGEVAPVAAAETGYLLGIDTDLSVAGAKPVWLRDIILGKGELAASSTAGRFRIVKGTDGDLIDLGNGTSWIDLYDRSQSTTTPVFRISESTKGARVQIFDPAVSTSIPLVVLDVADVTPSGTGWQTAKALALREIDECDASGNAKKRLYLCSAQY